MVIPIVIVVAIPIFLGIVYMPAFEQPEEVEPKVISEEPDMSILYFMLMGIWIIFLLRILIQLKRGTFKAMQRY